MGSEHEVVGAMLQPLRVVRQSLLRLHKSLLEWEREAYERAHGRIESSYELLRLVMHDPWFAWLRHLSELIVQIDEMLDAEEPLTQTTATAMLDQARVLLAATEAGNEFQRKYFAALQKSPDVVLAHSETVKLLGSAKLPDHERAM